MHAHLSSMKRSDVRHVEELLNALIQQVELRLFVYINDEDYQLATFLDPRFKDEKWITDEEKKILLKQRVIELVECELRDDSGATAQPSSSDEENLDAAVGGIMSKMFADSKPKPKKQCLMTTLDTAKMLVSDYLSSRPPANNDVAGFWREYPSVPLRNVARRYLGCPATSCHRSGCSP